LLIAGNDNFNLKRVGAAMESPVNVGYVYGKKAKDKID